MPLDANGSSVLTAVGDWVGLSDPHDPDPQPYPDLLPHVRTALEWLTTDQPAGCAWPKDGIVFPRPSGPDVSLRVMVCTSMEHGPRASIVAERCGGGSPVARITRAVSDRLRATITTLTPVTSDLAAIYMPGDTYTWHAVGLDTVTPSPGLVAAYELNQSGVYRTIYEPGYRLRVARLMLPAGWRPDHGGEYR